MGETDHAREHKKNDARYKRLDSEMEKSIPNYVHIVGEGDCGYGHELSALKSVLETYLTLDCIPIKDEALLSQTPNNVAGDTPIIFLSHKSDDQKYGDALERFIVGLGVKREQLIYTSHPLHKIPLDDNIYNYLRKNISKRVFMIILWSDKYLESPACMNEMGAAWVVQCDYTNIYVPTFSFGNPKYHECAVDTKKMGAVLNGDRNCRQNMMELKNKIQALFSLQNDEGKVSYLLDEFIKEIVEAAKDGQDEI